MFARLCCVILTLSIVFCALLSLRHQKLQCASELAQARLRIRDADEKLWRLRGIIAQRVTPNQVRRLAEASGLGPLTPATNDPSPVLQAMLQAREPRVLAPLAPQPTPKPATTKTQPVGTLRPSRVAQSVHKPAR